MFDNIYYCKNENNICLKKDKCLRYIDAVDQPAATLYKRACTEDNQYQLFIRKEREANDGETTADNTEESSS